MFDVGLTASPPVPRPPARRPCRRRSWTPPTRRCRLGWTLLRPRSRSSPPPRSATWPWPTLQCLPPASALELLSPMRTAAPALLSRACSALGPARTAALSTPAAASLSCAPPQAEAESELDAAKTSAAQARSDYATKVWRERVCLTCAPAASMQMHRRAICALSMSNALPTGPARALPRRGGTLSWDRALPISPSPPRTAAYCPQAGELEARAQAQATRVGGGWRAGGLAGCEMRRLGGAACQRAAGPEPCPCWRRGRAGLGLGRCSSVLPHAAGRWPSSAQLCAAPCRPPGVGDRAGGAGAGAGAAAGRPGGAGGRAGGGRRRQGAGCAGGVGQQAGRQPGRRTDPPRPANVSQLLPACCGRSRRALALTLAPRRLRCWRRSGRWSSARRRPSRGRPGSSRRRRCARLQGAGVDGRGAVRRAMACRCGSEPPQCRGPVSHAGRPAGGCASCRRRRWRAWRPSRRRVASKRRAAQRRALGRAGSRRRNRPRMRWEGCVRGEREGGAFWEHRLACAMYQPAHGVSLSLALRSRSILPRKCSRPS